MSNSGSSARNAGIGSAVCARRKALNMTLEQLGASIGVTAVQMRNYELGRVRIKFDRLVALSEALNCEFGQLLSAAHLADAANQRFNDDIIFNELGEYLTEVFFCVHKDEYKDTLCNMLQLVSKNIVAR